MKNLAVAGLCAVFIITSASAKAQTQRGDRCWDLANQNPATLAFLQLKQLEQGPVQNPQGVTVGSVAISSAESTAAAMVGNGGDPIGYTRLIVEFTPCPFAPPKNYASDRRGFLKQLFAGKEVDKSLNIVATINPIGVSQSLQLVHLNRSSGKDGEAWTTEISNGQNLSRYFLVDRATAVSLEFSFAENSKYTGSITSTLFNLIQRGAALIAPTSILITDDNRKRFTDAAKFVDDSVNGLMATNVKEKATVERIIGGSDSERTLAVVVLFATDANSTIRGSYQPIGMWTVKTDKIQAALFGPIKGNHLEKSALSASTIMSFRTDNEQTLGQLLAGKTSVSQAKDAYLKAAAAKKDSAAQALCSTIATELANLGFSPADVGGAVWAYARVLEPVSEARSPLQTNCKGIERYPS